MARKFQELTQDWTPERRARVRADTARMSRAITVSEIRKALGLTQATVAQALGVTQGHVSKLERQPDFYVSTLRRYIEAMHGEMKIVVSFPGRQELVLALAELEHDDEDTGPPAELVPAR